MTSGTTISGTTTSDPAAGGWQAGRPAILFDLDGTLADPGDSIFAGMRHALVAFGEPVPSDEVLRTFVGPPLADTFELLLGPERVESATALYREHFREHGAALTVLYPGVRELLQGLVDSGAVLAVATSKMLPFAEQILNRHGLSGLFSVVGGDNPDPGPGNPSLDKAQVITGVLGRLPAGTSGSPVMVGDRHHDVEGARSNGLECIGVDWGFAAPGELRAAGATEIVTTTAELGRVLRDRFPLLASGDPSSDGVLSGSLIDG